MWKMVKKFHFKLHALREFAELGGGSWEMDSQNM